MTTPEALRGWSGWHVQEVNLHSRRKPGMNHQVDRWVPATFPICQAATLQVSEEDNFHHANSLWQIQFGNVGVGVWTCSTVTDQFGSGAAPSLQAEGMMFCCPLPAKLLSPAPASPCLSWLSSSRQSVSPLHCKTHSGPLQSWHGRRWSGSDPQLRQQAAHRQPHALVLSGTPLPPPCSPGACALWVTRASRCLGVHHICVRTALRWAVLKTLTKD